MKCSLKDAKLEESGINMTGGAFYNCIFVACQLTWNKGQETIVQDCTFDEKCTFLGDGWPEHILEQQKGKNT